VPDDVLDLGYAGPPQSKRASQTANPTTAAAATANETIIQPDDECRSAKRDGVIVHGAYSGRSRSESNIPKTRRFRLDHDPASRCRRLHRAIPPLPFFNCCPWEGVAASLSLRVTQGHPAVSTPRMPGVCPSQPIEYPPGLSCVERVPAA
jgi:hypothetical protein